MYTKLNKIQTTKKSTNSNLNSASPWIGYHTIHGLQKTNESLVVNLRPISSKEDPLLPGWKCGFPNTLRWPKIYEQTANDFILLLHPKKSVLDRVHDWLINCHWLSGVYLTRIKKRSHDRCWFCEPSYNSQDTPQMTRTHVLLRCVAIEEIRRETWTDPLTGEFTRPSSIGQLLGNPRWEKRLPMFFSTPK
jgi:hypothetical protein